MKQFVAAVILSLVAMQAASSPIVRLSSVVNCNGAIDLPYWAAYINGNFPYYQTKDGASWHNGAGVMYGSKILSVYYSASGHQGYVGVVLEDPPVTVIPRIEQSRLFPTKVHKSGEYWVGASGMQIMWHEQRYTKLFCIGTRK